MVIVNFEQKTDTTQEAGGSKEVIPTDISDYLGKVMMDDDDDVEEETQSVSFEVQQDKIETLQKR